MDVDANVVGLVLMGLATVNGLVLFSMFALAARGRERVIDAGMITAHGACAGVAIAVWFAYTNGSGELGGARGLTVILIAIVLGAGLLMLWRWLGARRDDPHGEVIPEAAVKPRHLGGHLVVGAAAIAAVVIAAIRG